MLTSRFLRPCWLICQHGDCKGKQYLRRIRGHEVKKRYFIEGNGYDFWNLTGSCKFKGDGNHDNKYVLSERALLPMNFDTSFIKIG